MTTILDETPVEVKTAIIQNQIVSWKNARLDLVIARRVSLVIGDDVKAIDERLAKIERALLELETMLKEV